MEASKSISIIGAGIAGLSAGIYACQNGYKATIFEASQKVGGVCTSWERDGYYVNGSIHWLVGSSPGSELHQLWQQLGVIENSQFYNHQSFLEYRNIEGTDVHLYVDVNRLEKHLLEISPEDEEVILQFTQAIRTLSEAEFPIDRPAELYSFLDWARYMLKNFPAIQAMEKFNRLSVSEYAQRFRSTVLRTAFEHFWSPAMSMTFILLQFAFANKGTAGYPMGGSGKFVEKLERRFLELGGKIRFGEKVEKILTEGDRVVGLETKQGVSEASDYVISACDGHSVLFKLLDRKWVNEKIRAAYQSLRTFPAILYFSAGVRRIFDDVSPSIMGLNIPLEPAVNVGGFEHRRATFQIYNFDPSLAPRGKTLITAILHTHYDLWKIMYENDRQAYEHERERIGKELLENLERSFPGIRDQLDFVDTATPITYERWTGNYKGSYEGWLPTPESSKIQLPSHLKGLHNFYMAGHWVVPGGGMPPAAYSGRNAVQLICKQEKRHFGQGATV